MAHTLDHIAAERREELTASRWAGLREMVTTEWPTWEEFGRSGEPVFYDPDAPVSIALTTPSGIEKPMYPVFSLGTLFPGAGSRADDPPQLPGAGWWTTLWEERETKQAAPEDNGLTLEDPPEGAIPAGFEWLSNLPGEFGEAGGEFFANLFGPPLGTLAAVPGSVFENIPIWVPLLGAAYLLTRK